MTDKEIIDQIVGIFKGKEIIKDKRLIGTVYELRGGEQKNNQYAFISVNGFLKKKVEVFIADDENQNPKKLELSTDVGLEIWKAVKSLWEKQEAGKKIKTNKLTPQQIKAIEKMGKKR